MKKTIVSVAATTLITTAFTSQVLADTYKVQSGDSLWSISNKYSISISELKKWNSLKSDLIFPNQVLTVTKNGQESKPSTTTSKPANHLDQKQSEVKTYTVKAGDTLSAIASKYNISLSDLRAWNNSKSDLIYPGDVLKVSKMTSVIEKQPTSKEENTSPSVTKPSASQSTSTYTVKAGDSLWKISQSTGVSISDLKKQNNITSDLIYIGQKLVLKGQASQPDKSTSPVVTQPSTDTSSAIVQKAISTATKVLGSPYLWAGSTPAGFDCSGFIYYAFSEAGLSIPRTSTDGYYSRSYYVTKPQPGDLVFFENTYKSGISHVGIYLGNNQFINADDNGVNIASLDNSYWKSHFDGFKRLYELN